MKTLSILLLVLLPLGAAAGTVYLTDDQGTADLGVRDENILADDIHLEHAAIVTNILIPLAIAGTQSCGLWIFDSLNAPPFHYQAFTNIASSSRFAPQVQVFSLHVPVPKDFFIGISAQGGGWDANGVDAIRCGSDIITGIASNSALYYYGPVAGGQLTTEYPTAGGPGYFTVQVKEAPLMITGLHIGDSGVTVTGTNCFPGATHRLERSTGGVWTEVTSFIAADFGADSLDTNESFQALYRLQRE